MPFRQIFIVLLALIAIVGAALFVLSWSGDEDDAGDGAITATTDENGDETDLESTTSTTSTTTTTTIVPVTTSIPAACGITDEGTTDATTSTTTMTLPADDAETPDEPLIPTLGRNSSLSTVGLDRVHFGLTVKQATEAAGTEFNPCGPVGACYRVTPAEAPAGISFVVHDGTIERVDIVGDSPIKTVSKFGIGTTAEELDAKFGERLERVDLGGGAIDVIFVPADANDAEFRVVFTTVDGVVETLRSGRIPLVLETEPCA